MSNSKLDTAIWSFAKSFPFEGMSGERGWTNSEVKRVLERIGCGKAVSHSEYTVAMSFFYRAQAVA